MYRLITWWRGVNHACRRWWCRRFGHVNVTAGVEGLLTFPACRRCGKWGRVVVHGELRS